MSNDLNKTYFSIMIGMLFIFILVSLISNIITGLLANIILLLVWIFAEISESFSVKEKS